MTIIISVTRLCISLLTLMLTQLKMNKSEQIKILHDIQLRYSTAFERYKEEVMDHQQGDDLPQFLIYAELLKILE